MTTNDKHDEHYWVESFRRRENDALAYFFDYHYKSLYFFVNRLIKDDTESEDIVTDCFIKLWKSDYNVQHAENIKAFLYISCKNAALNYIKREKIKSTVQETYSNSQEKSENTILLKIVEAEVIELLSKEIESLPEKYRAVFKLIYFEHKKTDEIAELLDLSVKTVRNYKAKAVELLKASVIKKGISDHLYLAFILFLIKR